MRRIACLLLLMVATADCGSSSSPPSSSITECPGVTVPATLTLTVSGYASCTCFNGQFTLTEANGEWSSAPITGCPGQSKTAYFKFTTHPGTGDGVNGGTPGVDAGATYDDLALGVTDANSIPGSGNSDLAPATAYTCSPLSIRGAGSRAGNITAFCPSAEDENMTWVIAAP
jgi:hypothetical protein